MLQKARAPATPGKHSWLNALLVPFHELPLSVESLSPKRSIRAAAAQLPDPPAPMVPVALGRSNAVALQRTRQGASGGSKGAAWIFAADV